MSKYDEVTPGCVRQACILCRDFENFVKLFHNFLASLEPPNSKAKSSSNLNDRINWIEAKIKHLPELVRDCISFEELQKSVFTKLEDSDCSSSLIEVLHQMRKIRNKVAHPADITLHDVKDLIRFSECLYKYVVNTIPLEARIVSAGRNSAGLVEIGFYSEADRRCDSPQRATIQYPVLENGSEVDKEKILDIVDRECIIFPFLIHESRRRICYKLGSNPIAVLKDPKTLEESPYIVKVKCREKPLETAPPIEQAQVVI